MITFSRPRAGWMTLQIGSQFFDISYLSDLWSELDYLLNLKDDMHVNKIRLEGESAGDLYLTATLKQGEETLTILWEEAYSDDAPVVMQYKFDEFKKEYEQAKEDIGMEYYIKHFICEDRYDKVTDVDNFIYDYNNILKKYDDVTISVREEYDYDYNEDPYLSGHYLEVVDYKTGEHRYIEGD